ncbi:MAG: hypothetical protein J5672_06550, partial [Verrucomicrobia bacterium]|nr:hypothetical protein [Verrucomicrobiota bacterium]
SIFKEHRFRILSPRYLQSICPPPKRDNQLLAPDLSLKKAKSSPISYLLWNYITAAPLPQSAYRA